MNVKDFKFTVKDATRLCDDYGINFSIEAERDYLVYCFGPVKWAVTEDFDFSFESYITVIQKLAAIFPEKVLGLK